MEMKTSTIFGTIALVFLTSSLWAEPTKTVFSPFTGKLDYITKIDSSTAITVASISLYDSAGCLWTETVNTSGSWIASLISCPAAPAAFVPCVPGTPLGLLSAITCP